MASFLRRWRQRFCAHAARRIWDIHRLPDGNYRVRLYCPSCGWRKDVVRDAEDVARDVAGTNPEMLDTLRRNLGLDDMPPDT